MMAGQFLHSRSWRWAASAQAALRRFLVVFGRGAAALLAIALLASCSLGMIYPRLDTLASWQLDNYLKLESGQERWLDGRLEERLAWHQREQLPKWREELATLRQDVAEGRIDADRHQQLSEVMRDLIRASMTGLVDDTVQLAGKLTDTQVQHLLQEFDEDTEDLQEEIAERAADPADAEHERRENLQEDVEQWLGSYSKEQAAYLQQWSDGAIRWSDYALESRQRWRDFIVQTLTQRGDPAAARAAIEQMLLRPESLRTETYQDAVTRHTEHRRALHLHLLQTMSEKQKAHLLSELDELIEDIDDLLAD
jgi:hypothetical protein